MYLTLTPTATEFINNANDALNPNETKFLLWLLVGMLFIIGVLISVMWNALTDRVGKIDDTMTASLQTHVETRKDIESLKNSDERIEKKVDKLDDRIFTVERKLGGFMAPPGRGLQQG